MQTVQAYKICQTVCQGGGETIRILKVSDPNTPPQRVIERRERIGNFFVGDMK